MVDAALSRILRDILALPDITEVESHRLNELCHILNALEGLFVETSFQVMAVSHPVLSMKRSSLTYNSLPLSFHMYRLGSSFHTSRNYWSVPSSGSKCRI